MAVATLGRANCGRTARQSADAVGLSQQRKDCGNSGNVSGCPSRREENGTGATTEQKCELNQRLVARQAASSPGKSVTHLFSLRDHSCVLVHRKCSREDLATTNSSSKKSPRRENTKTDATPSYQWD